MSNSLQSTPAVSVGIPTALASAVPCQEIASAGPIVPVAIACTVSGDACRTA